MEVIETPEFNDLEGCVCNYGTDKHDIKKLRYVRFCDQHRADTQKKMRNQENISDSVPPDMLAMTHTELLFICMVLGPQAYKQG